MNVYTTGIYDNAVIVDSSLFEGVRLLLQTGYLLKVMCYMIKTVVQMCKLNPIFDKI